MNEHLNMDKASHIFKHLQESPGCRALCSSECFVVIDQATTRTQLKIKIVTKLLLLRPFGNLILLLNLFIVLDFCIGFEVFVLIVTVCRPTSTCRSGHPEAKILP